MLFNSFAKAFSQDRSGGHISFREDYDELLTSITGGNIEIPEGPPDTVSGFTKNLISGLMSESIVERLEAVYIHHYEGQRELIALRAFDFLGKALFQVSPVEKAGKRISNSQHLKAMGTLQEVDLFDGCGYIGSKLLQPAQVSLSIFPFIQTVGDVDYCQPS